jgi:hypothetical protein
MSFGSGSGSGSVSGMSNVRGSGAQQGILRIALFVVAAVALIGVFLRKPTAPAERQPALDPVTARRRTIQQQAPIVKPVALEMTAQVTRDWMQLDGVQDKQGIDNLVVGIVKTAYRKQLGDSGYIQIFGAPGSTWTYSSLQDAVGSDMMNAVRAQVIQLNEEFRRSLRHEARRG